MQALHRGTTTNTAKATPAFHQRYPSTEPSPRGRGGQGASLDSSGCKLNQHHGV